MKNIIEKISLQSMDGVILLTFCNLWMENLYFRKMWMKLKGKD